MPKGTMRRREWEHLLKGSENVKIKSSEGTSHQPYGKCHVDGVGETLSFPLRQVLRPQASTRVEVKVNAKVKVNRLIAPGITKTLEASPV